MCGIIGYAGKKNAKDILLSGLSSLEYRGYDSAGISVFDENGVTTVKTAGRVNALKTKIGDGLDLAHCGIGHTRWATHGAPNDKNAHPHTQGLVTLVHNGIIENHASLRDSLEKSGYIFTSDTDTEAAAAMIDLCYKINRDPLTAISNAIKSINGSYAFAIMFADIPGKLFAAKKDSPLIIGVGKNENFIASDITAILGMTKNYIGLSDGELAWIDENEIKIFDSERNEIKKEISVAFWDTEAAEKGGYPHFMLKEINEEPTALRATLTGRIKNGLPDFSGDTLDVERIASANRLYIVACGTAMHAGLYGKYMIEKFVRRSCEVEIASEFRYKNPILDSGDAVIIISQSGETADSLAALRLAKSRGAYAAAIVNVVSSSIAREADGVLYTHAGPEIAVASTKAYTVQSAALLLIALSLAQSRKTKTEDEIRAHMTSLSVALPELIANVIAEEEQIKSVAEKCYKSEDIFFIGRGIDRYLADEASLKLKEISYIHSEAYAAGELKHGTISLVEDGVPVIAIATEKDVYEKLESNLREVRARGAKTVLIRRAGLGGEGDAQYIIELPSDNEVILPIAAVTVCQIFAYHMAILRGTDADRPRNLAKSVTVE